MWRDARWIKVPFSEVREKQIWHGDLTGRFACFRCELELPTGVSLTVDITANSRYRLWVNGSAVLSGPCKGDQHRQYYETVELTGLLRPGKNVFCAQVLYCDPDTADIQTDARASIYGVIGQRCGHRLAVEGDVVRPDGTAAASLTTGTADWRVWLDNSFCLTSDETTQFLGAVKEDIDFNASPAHWKEIGFDASGWAPAALAEPVVPSGPLWSCGVHPRFHVLPRPIPLLYEQETAFVRAFRQADGASAGLLESGSITVPAGEELSLILDAGAVVNGYPRYVLRGEGAEAEFVYFEKFGGAGSDLRRDDWEHGAVSGITDRIRLSTGETVYEPFWVRTFRFIRVTLRAGAVPASLLSPTFHKTVRPLRKDRGRRRIVETAKFQDHQDHGICGPQLPEQAPSERYRPGGRTIHVLSVPLFQGYAEHNISGLCK